MTVPTPTRDPYSDGLFEPEAGRYDRLADRDQWHFEAARRVSWLRRSQPRGRVIELGSATGEFVAAAEAAGYDAIGLETSAYCVTHASELTSRVLRMELDQWMEENPRQVVDAVAMFHVLEHVHDPQGLLSSIHRVLRPGGLLILEVPNGRAPGAQPHGQDWWMASLSDHVHHHTAQGVEHMLRICGFDNVTSRRLSILAYRRDRGWGWMYWRLRAVVRHASPAGSQDLLRVSARRV